MLIIFQFSFPYYYIFIQLAIANYCLAPLCLIPNAAGTHSSNLNIINNMAAPLRMGTRGKQLFRVAIKCKWSERSERVGENKREREEAKSKGMKNEEKQLNAKQKQSLVLDEEMEMEKELEQPLLGQKENKEINLRELHLRHVEKRPRQCQLSLIEIKLKAVGVEGRRCTVRASLFVGWGQACKSNGNSKTYSKIDSKSN